MEDLHSCCTFAPANKKYLTQILEIMKSEDFYASYNETMFDERDVIQHFLEQQFDLRYGHQRDYWNFEPALKLVASNGGIVSVRYIRLDKDAFVMFGVEATPNEWECFKFAYGELSKVINALPDADEIVKKNAVNDLREITMNYNTSAILKECPFEVNGQQIKDIEGCKEGIKLVFDTTSLMLGTSLVVPLRDYMRVSILHGYDEYKKLVKFLSEQPNLCFEPANFGDVEFTIHGTDVKVDVLSASLDANDKLQLCVNDDNEEPIYLEEKDIRPEYLVNLVGYIEDNCICDIMDTYNGHNAELVRKINKAWKNEEYHGRFGDILFALGSRDKQEIQDKLDVVIDCNETAMNNAHQIMESVCDDWDLETILSFIRYEE